MLFCYNVLSIRLKVIRFFLSVSLSVHPLCADWLMRYDIMSPVLFFCRQTSNDVGMQILFQPIKLQINPKQMGLASLLGKVWEL